MTRSESREQALKLIYQKLFNPEMTFSEIAGLNAQELDTKSDAYSLDLSQTVFENIQMLDGIISSKLKNWTISRLQKLTLCILRLSVAELEFFPETPCAVVANEAVELTKKFVGEKEAGFVNAVLGSVINDKNGVKDEKDGGEAPAAEETEDK